MSISMEKNIKANLARSQSLNMKKHVMSLRGAALELWRKNGGRLSPTQGKEKDLQVEKASRSLQHLPRGCTSTEKVS